MVSVSRAVAVAMSLVMFTGMGCNNREEASGTTPSNDGGKNTVSPPRRPPPVPPPDPKPPKVLQAITEEAYHEESYDITVGFSADASGKFSLHAELILKRITPGQIKGPEYPARYRIPSVDGETFHDVEPVVSAGVDSYTASRDIPAFESAKSVEVEFVIDHVVMALDEPSLQRRTPQKTYKLSAVFEIPKDESEGGGK